jgi:hypothetical protein
MTTPLTIESLARAIHEDELAAVKAAGFIIADVQKTAVQLPFDELSPAWKACRLDQARRMFQRIMR